MRLVNKILNKKEAFTIVELLTVMSIIVILISLLVPSLNMVKRYARKVKQKAQFHSISVAMDLFNHEWEGYPDSDRLDETETPYCGAMKLCEAMVGQDLMGFHPASRFRSDGTNGAAVSKDLYTSLTIKERRGPYLQLENANAYKLKHLYGTGGIGLFEGERFVLCDVYSKVSLRPDLSDSNDTIGGKAGMPILYYKANAVNTLHDYTAAPEDNIYNYLDNHDLAGLGKPWDPAVGNHRLWEYPETFYEMIKNEKITTVARPHRSDSYILLSAGFDGEYGTADDVFNFEP